MRERGEGPILYAGTLSMTVRGICYLEKINEALRRKQRGYLVGCLHFWGKIKNY